MIVDHKFSFPKHRKILSQYKTIWHLFSVVLTANPRRHLIARVLKHISRMLSLDDLHMHETYHLPIILMNPLTRYKLNMQGLHIHHPHTLDL